MKVVFHDSEKQRHTLLCDCGHQWVQKDYGDLTCAKCKATCKDTPTNPLCTCGSGDLDVGREDEPTGCRRCGRIWLLLG
jgi:hypothetical protein